MLRLPICGLPILIVELSLWASLTWTSCSLLWLYRFISPNDWRASPETIMSHAFTPASGVHRISLDSAMCHSWKVVFLFPLRPFTYKSVRLAVDSDDQVLCMKMVQYWKFCSNSLSGDCAPIESASNNPSRVGTFTCNMSAQRVVLRLCRGKKGSIILDDDDYFRLCTRSDDHPTARC